MSRDYQFSAHIASGRCIATGVHERRQLWVIFDRSSRFCSPVHVRFTPKAAAVASREDCPHARFALIIDRCRSLDIARHIDGS
jgi:hypothetical protein